MLLDLVMPNLDGVDAFARIRRSSPDVPIVLVSGYAEEEVTRRFEGERLDGFLKKPYRMTELLAQIESVLATRNQERQA